MATFDGWDAPLYGYSLPNGQDTLAHFRTKGSKNGVRRYQTESGEWTPLGLRLRKAREGWGEGRQERKAARKEARKERRAAAAAYLEKRKKLNPKNMTDEELRKAIDRKKLEMEYKDLNRSQLLKTAGNLVSGYLKAKDEKLKRAERAQQMEINRTRAKADLIKAKAENRKYIDAIIDNVTSGAKKKGAKADLKKAKNEERKHTIRGAISESVGNILRKEGNRFVKEMKDDSAVMKGGRFVKKAFKATGKAVKNRAVDVYEGVKQGYKEGRAEVGKERERVFDPEDYDRKARKRLGL